MFGGKFQNVWREAKKWQRQVASFFVDRIPYKNFKIFGGKQIKAATLSGFVFSTRIPYGKFLDFINYFSLS